MMAQPDPTSPEIQLLNLEKLREVRAVAGVSLEEAERDLGASAWGAFRFVTFPLLVPAVAAGAMLAFALSFDDLVITTFNAGVGSSTLPLHLLQDPVRSDARDQRHLGHHRDGHRHRGLPRLALRVAWRRTFVARGGRRGSRGVNGWPAHPAPA